MTGLVLHHKLEQINLLCIVVVLAQEKRGHSKLLDFFEILQWLVSGPVKPVKHGLENEKKLLAMDMALVLEVKQQDQN